MNGILSGLYGGFIATGPMTLFLFARHAQLPKSERSPLPPATLTYETIHIPNSAATLSAHFAYGAASGALYGATIARAKVPPLIKGIAYGLGVWTVSYLGISPGLGYRAAAPRMPLRRNLMMIAAHVVWGASLGYAVEKLQASGNEMLEGNQGAPQAE